MTVHIIVYVKKRHRSDQPFTSCAEMDHVRQSAMKTFVEALDIVAKSKLTNKKIVFCVWWDYERIIHYGPLQSGETIDSDLYCQRLKKLSEVIKKKPS